MALRTTLRWRWAHLAGITALLLAGVACTGDDDDDGGETPTSTVAAESPTETESPAETATEPATTSPTAGATQTEPAASPTEPEEPTVGPPPEISLTDAFPNVPDMQRPIELIAMPPDDPVLLFVALQDGRIMAWADDPEVASGAVIEVLDTTGQVRRDGNEEGLLGLAVDPDYANGRPYIYLYYTVADGERRSRISRMEAEIGDHAVTIRADTELTILEVPQPYPNHNGGKIAFGPDGHLYIALGDGGDAGDPHGNGQNPSTLLGSILRIDVREATEEAPYAIPEDNPFADGEDGRPEIFAHGLRNPWRFSFDSEGRLWAGDVGQNAFEEIDLVEAGNNYGWNIMEGFACYNASSCDQEGLTLPITAYGREQGDCSVTGGVVYELVDDTGLWGWYLYGDYCSGIIRGFPADEAAETGEAEAVELGGGPQVASFAQTENGVYVLAFDGRIYTFE